MKLNKIEKDIGQYKLGIAIVVVGVLGRLVPHIPNITPFTNISLFAGKSFSRLSALLILGFTLVVSDISLALLFGYPVFGYWTLFTYTGSSAITYFGSKLQHSSKKLQLPLFIFLSSIGFWVWTNFGVWLTSGMYPKTLVGLSKCYIVALPFLRNALLGDMIWGGIIFWGLAVTRGSFKTNKYIPCGGSRS